MAGVLFWVAVLTSLVSWQRVHALGQEGDDCTLMIGGLGVCKQLRGCPAALKNLQKNKVRPETCSIDVSGRNPIVCCPTRNQTTSATTTPQPILTNGNSQKMCEKYASAVFELVTIDAALTTDPYVVNNSECVMSGQQLIVGGKKTVPKEYPHMALLGYGDEDNKEWKCGGSLISERYVLTAAHCTEYYGRKVMWALMGDVNYKNDDDEARPLLAQIVDWILHPKYAYPTFNDIALLKLKDDVIFNPFVRPACLNTEPQLTVGSVATATGWGVVNISNFETSADLMKVGLNIDLPSGCRNAFNTRELKKLGFNEKTMICAGDTSLTPTNGTWKDSCLGDSGGPLQTSLLSPFCMYNIIGVTSYGSSFCGLNRQSAVYTRVSNFVPWIESIVWPT